MAETENVVHPTISSQKRSMIPDRPTLIRMLSSALRIPSGDNCQPWYFRQETDKLLIFHDESRGQHALNRASHASMLSFGCLAEALIMSASVESLNAEVTPLFATEMPEEGKPWGELRFSVSFERVHPLVVALINRSTDRRLYKGGDLSEAVFREIATDALLFSNIELRLLPRAECSQPFLDYVTQIETSCWTTEPEQQDLMKWIRFSDSDAKNTRDGMPWRTLGISFAESRVLKLAKSFATQQVMNKAGFLGQTRKLIQKQVLSSAGLVSWVTRHPSAASLYAVGRLAFRAWLRLVKAGYAVQPMTLSSLYFYSMSTNALKDAPVLPLLKEALPTIRQTFSLSQDQFPVWTLRTGLSEPLPPENRTFRLDTESLLK